MKIYREFVNRIPAFLIEAASLCPLARVLRLHGASRALEPLDADRRIHQIAVFPWGAG